jgi:hypothetical protein
MVTHNAGPVRQNAQVLAVLEIDNVEIKSR